MIWRTASYSGAGENCVEIAPAADRVLVRHSKHPSAGTITFPSEEWPAFLRDAARQGSAAGNGVAAIRKVGTDTSVTSAGVELLFDEGEWSAFLAGVADGEFDFPR